MSEQSTSPQTEAKRRRGIQVFRFSDAEDLTEAHMPMEGVDEGVIAGFTKLAEAGGVDSGGETVRCLFKEPRDDGLSLCYAWFKSGYVLPRHSHNADCVYFIVAGEIRLGKQVLGKGDGFFVPADAPYSYETGPEGAEVLEFRNASRFHILFRNNDEAHWERMAKAFRERRPHWSEETVPPSDRQTG